MRRGGAAYVEGQTGKVTRMKSAYDNAIKLLRLARNRRDYATARNALARAKLASALIALGYQ